MKNSQASIILQAEHLSHSYGTRVKPIPLFSDINFSIPQNHLALITGPSGAGKTTLLNIMAALLRPTAGTIRYLGNDIYKGTRSFQQAAYRSEHIGFVFQNFHLIPYLTVLDNVLLPFYFSTTPVFQKKKRGLFWLDQLGILDKWDVFPHQLSGGQMQRVAIARALVKDPSLIFADEPTGNLDDQTAQEIVTIVLNLQKEKGITFVIVTHSSLFTHHAQTVFYLDKGTIQSFPSMEP